MPKPLRTKETAPRRLVYRMWADSVYGPQLASAKTRTEQASILRRARSEYNRLRKRYA